MTKLNSKTCPDCGNAPVNHRTEKTVNLVNRFMHPVILSMDMVWGIFEPLFGGFIFNTLSPTLYRALFRLKLGTIVREPDVHTSSRAKAFWNEAMRRGIYMWEFRLGGLPRELFVAEWNGRQIGFDGLPRPGQTLPRSLLWIDNKGIMRKKFSAFGLPIAKGGVARTKNHAIELFEKLEKPLIIKPDQGSRSRHTTIHIENSKHFEKAFNLAKMLSPWVVIEEEHVGLVHRATVIGGKVVGILRREPAFVIGNGTDSIETLIKEANKHPARKGPIFHEIEITSDVLGELKRQKLDLKKVPEKGRLVTLGEKASRGLGGGATDFTDNAHRDNIELFEKVAVILKDPIVGIDFIIRDITCSWKDTPRSGIIECNSLPFIDLHLYPLVGTPRNTSGDLWDLIFPDSKKV